jgi:RNA polymerase-associated protein LEO1
MATAEDGYANLFGEDEADGDDDQVAPTAADLFGDDDQAEEERGEERGANASSLPSTHVYIPARPGNAARVSSMRLPKVMSVSSRLYQREEFEERGGEEAERQELAAQGKPFAIDARIRWKLTGSVDPESGHPELATNTRIVEWSDGSMTLHIGASVFDVVSQTGDSANSTQIFSRVISQQPQSKTTRRETVLEGQELVSARYLLRAREGNTASAMSLFESRVASDKDAATLSTSSSAPAKKRARVEKVNLFVDPEVARKKRIHEEEDAIRKLEAQKRKGEQALRATGRSSSSASAYSRGGEEGEGEAEEGTIKHPKKPPRDDEDEEDEEEEEEEEEESADESGSSSSDSSSGSDSSDSS